MWQSKDSFGGVNSGLWIPTLCYAKLGITRDFRHCEEAKSTRQSKEYPLILHLNVQLIGY